MLTSTMNNVTVTEQLHGLNFFKKEFRFFLFLCIWKDNFAKLKVIKACHSIWGPAAALLCTNSPSLKKSCRLCRYVCVILKRDINVKNLHTFQVDQPSLVSRWSTWKVRWQFHNVQIEYNKTTVGTVGQTEQRFCLQPVTFNLKTPSNSH